MVPQLSCRGGRVSYRVDEVGEEGLIHFLLRHSKIRGNGLGARTRSRSSDEKAIQTVGSRLVDWVSPYSRVFEGRHLLSWEIHIDGIMFPSFFVASLLLGVDRGLFNSRSANVAA